MLQMVVIGCAIIDLDYFVPFLCEIVFCKYNIHVQLLNCILSSIRLMKCKNICNYQNLSKNVNFQDISYESILSK